MIVSLQQDTSHLVDERKPRGLELFEEDRGVEIVNKLFAHTAHLIASVNKLGYGEFYGGVHPPVRNKESLIDSDIPVCACTGLTYERNARTAGQELFTKQETFLSP